MSEVTGPEAIVLAPPVEVQNLNPPRTFRRDYTPRRNFRVLCDICHEKHGHRAPLFSDLAALDTHIKLRHSGQNYVPPRC